MEDFTASFGESLQDFSKESQEADRQYNAIHGERSKQTKEFKATEDLPNKDQIVAMWKTLIALDNKSLEAHKKRCPEEGRLCLPMCPHSASPEYQKWLKQSERVRGACGYIYCPQKTINQMVKFIDEDLALSFASGGGFLESLLEKKRVRKVIATDVRPPEVRFMPIWRASTVEAVNHWEDAGCLIISFPFSDFKSNASEEEDNQNKNITQIFKGDKLIYIGSADPSLTGQQPDTTIWEQLTVETELTEMYYLTKDVSQVMVRFFKRRESSVD